MWLKPSLDQPVVVVPLFPEILCQLRQQLSATQEKSVAPGAAFGARLKGALAVPLRNGSRFAHLRLKWVMDLTWRSKSWLKLKVHQIIQERCILKSLMGYLYTRSFLHIIGWQDRERKPSKYFGSARTSLAKIYQKSITMHTVAYNDALNICVITEFLDLGAWNCASANPFAARCLSRQERSQSSSSFSPDLSSPFPSFLKLFLLFE